MNQKRPQYLLGLVQEDDGRMTRPDEQEKKLRLASFRRGWTAALAGEQYTRETLRSLKWDNYGYRMGLLEGETHPDMQEKIFEALYASQQWKLDQPQR
jgi:hypothetical protein